MSLTHVHVFGHYEFKVTFTYEWFHLIQAPPLQIRTLAKVHILKVKLSVFVATSGWILSTILGTFVLFLLQNLKYRVHLLVLLEFTLVLILNTIVLKYQLSKRKQFYNKLTKPNWRKTTFLGDLYPWKEKTGIDTSSILLPLSPIFSKVIPSSESAWNFAQQSNRFTEKIFLLLWQEVFEIFCHLRVVFSKEQLHILIARETLYLLCTFEYFLAVDLSSKKFKKRYNT